MNKGYWSIFTIFVIVISMAACQQQPLGESDILLRSALKFDLRSLAGSPQQSASVIDSFMLQIEQSDGEQQTISMRLDPQDNLLVIDVEVVAGQTEFTSEIYSNNGTTLYAGNRTVNLSENGFDVTIELQPLSGILCITPPSLLLNQEMPDTLILENKGSQSIDWSIGTVSPFPPEFTVMFSKTSGEIRAGQQDLLIIDPDEDANSNFIPGVFNLPIESDVGTADAVVELRLVADLLPVPDASGLICVRRDDSLVVTIRNRGLAASQPSVTEVDFFSFGVVALPTPALAPDEFVELLVRIPPNCYDSDCEFLITVDVMNDISEANEGNNVVIGICLG